MSGATKNQWGCIPDNMRLRNHPYFDQLIWLLNEKVKTRLAIADGTYFLDGSGPMFGHPVAMNVVAVADSYGAMDAALCEVMGLPLRSVRYLKRGQKTGHIPTVDSIRFNRHPRTLYAHQFKLNPTLRSRTVRLAFDHPIGISLLWDSWIADKLHAVLYAFTRNQVADDLHNWDRRTPIA
jgi:uncharacterized protein (DUF362 family)